MTTRPPLSPVANSSPSWLNSTHDIMSAAKKLSARSVRLYNHPVKREECYQPPCEWSQSTASTTQHTTGNTAMLVERTQSRIFYTAQKKATIHQVTTMLATSKNVLFPGPNHRRWWPDTLIIAQAPSAPVVSRLLLLGPGNRTFLEVACMVVTWWIVVFFCTVLLNSCSLFPILFC